jgi:hypothetical protein
MHFSTIIFQMAQDTRRYGQDLVLNALGMILD